MWKWLTGDVNFTDYGGSWYRKIDDLRYHVIRLDNWEDMAGADASEYTYNVTLSEVNLGDADQLQAAMKSCGWEDGTDDYGNPLPDLAKVDAMHGFGARAHLGEWNGNNYRKMLAEAKRESRSLDDPDTYEDAMNKPVNAIGSTARELQKGDVQSAILRGLAEGDPKAELMCKLGVLRARF